ncbi:hypothetical protein GDO78_018765 [Eleutherodactylus coqui]|uniref:Uncharacterized protein n=2 Tax=Eleutherodactylus coqui TaxID=57060 RepID=A0A8J6EAX2_ELECQ|nr:hypothetical protein GDO78_018765 [Eleutherodactylus coqui]
MKEIFMVKFTDHHRKHLKRWLEKKEGATDWSFVFQKVCELEGNRDKWQEKEAQVRKSIKGVIEWDDFENSSVITQLPEVDCVLSLWKLNVVSKTKEELQRNLKKFTCSLKPGGQLILFTVVNMSYYKLGEQKFFVFKVDIDDIKESLNNAGFVIEEENYLPKKVITDIVDYEGLFFILARKKSESPI